MQSIINQENDRQRGSGGLSVWVGAVYKKKSKEW